MTTPATDTVDLTTPTVPLELIHVHPNNARWSAVADDEMVESVRSIGIAQALTVMPYAGGVCPLHERCYTLGAGHRRRDAAEKAGLAEVPVLYRDDLVTEAQQLEFMLVENLHRSDLSPAEQAAAFEQLTLFGHDVADIAAATGVSQATVRSRLKLNALPEAARNRLHAGEATLADAEAMLEFSDDVEATTELEETIGTANYRAKVQELRHRRERAARHQERIDEFEAQGATRWTPREGDYVAWSRDGACPLMWFGPGDLRDPEAHDGCLGYYYAGAASYADPVLICTDAGSHATPVDPAAEEERARRDAEWRADQEKRAAAQARRDAAAAARLEWLTDHFSGLLPAKGHQPLAAAARVLLPLLITDGDGPAALHDALGLPAGAFHERYAAAEAYAADLAGATPTKVLTALGRYLASLVADQLAAEVGFVDEPADLQRLLTLWDWLRSTGYELSDADVEIRTRLETAYAEATTDEAP